MSALLLVALLSARPVQATFRGELESLDFGGHSTGVVATFDAAAPLAQGKAAVDACTTPVAGQATTRAGFLRTPLGPLAVVHPAEPATARALLGLAQCLSKQKGVQQTHAFFYPRADSGVEVEAVWRFKDGVRVDRTVFSFRDDPEYVRFVRRAMTRSEFVTHQWKGGWPLSKLAVELKLPGRDGLEHHGTLMWEGSDAPTDAGEDLAQTTLSLPRALALELLQEAEAMHASASKLMAEALLGAQQAKALGEGAATDPTVKERTVTLYLPRALLASVEVLGDTNGESVSALSRKAWQRAHGEKPAEKDKK